MKAKKIIYLNTDSMSKTLPRIVIYRDYDGKIKTGYASSWVMAFAMYQTMLDPGILVAAPRGGLKIIPGPRQDILYMFTIKHHQINEYPGY